MPIAHAIASLNMSKAEVDALLSNFDYDKALAVYLPHCANATLKKLLTTSRNTFTTKKLKEGLRSLATTPETQQEKIDHSVALHSSTIPVKSQYKQLQEDYREAPLEVQKKISERIDLVNEARLLKRDLHKMTDLDRREACLTIARNWQKAQACYDYEQYYKEHRELPPEKVQSDEIVLPEDPFQMLKRFKTLKTYKARSTWKNYELEYQILETKLKEIGAI